MVRKRQPWPFQGLPGRVLADSGLFLAWNCFLQPHQLPPSYQQSRNKGLGIPDLDLRRMEVLPHAKKGAERTELRV